MPVYDFSSGLNLLNQGISSLGDALGARTDAQAYAQIGDALSRGDYSGAAARAWQAGKPDIAMKLQQQAFGMNIAGGLTFPGAPGAGTGAAQPSADGTVPAKLSPDQGAAAPSSAVKATVSAGSPGGRWAPPGMSAMDVQNYITQAAIARNIDPQVAVQVAHSEWGKTYSGDNNMSFGPFQLYTGGGLGNVFQKQTGLDPSNPATWKQQIDFALDQAAANKSWAPWHGAANSGIPNQAGLQGARPIGVGLGQGPMAGAPQVAPAGQAIPSFGQPGVPPVGGGAPVAPPGPQAAAGGGVGSFLGPNAANAAPAVPPPGGAPNALAAANQGPQPAGPPMSQLMLMQGIASGQLQFPQVIQNWKAWGLPDPSQPQSAQFWQALRNVALQAKAQPGAANAASAGPTQTPGGPQPTALPPNGAATPPTPPSAPPGGAPPNTNLASGFLVPETPFPGTQAPFPSTTPRGAGSPATPQAPAPPRAPPSTVSTTAPAPTAPPPPQSAVAKDVPGPQTSAQPPASTLPTSSKSEGPPPTPPRRPASMGNLPQGVVGYLPSGEPIYAGDPQANIPRNLKGTPAANQAELAGTAGPAPPAGAGMANRLAPGQIPPQFMQPPGGAPPGTTQAALPPAPGGPGAPMPAPGAQPPAGGGGGLTGLLGGLGAGLLNLGSMQPPGGVPGLPTPAQNLGVGPAAPLPGSPGFPRPPGAMPPPMAAGGPQAQPAMAAPPGAAAAAPAPAGAAAQPAGPVDPINAQIQQLQARSAALHQQAIRASFLSPEAAKPYEDAANKLDDQINELVKTQQERISKTGEVQQGAQKEQAGVLQKGFADQHAKLTGASGIQASLENINAMEGNLQDAARGLGSAQGLGETIAGLLAPFDPNFAGLAAGSQEFNARGTQEMIQMANQLFAQGRLNRTEFNAIRDGTFTLGDRPDVVYDMLELARSRALLLAKNHNEQLDRFAKNYAPYGGAESRDQFHVDLPEELTKPGNRAQITGTGATSDKPLRVHTPADLKGLPKGTWVMRPDGQVKQIGAEAAAQ